MQFASLRERAEKDWQRIRQHPMVVAIGQGTLERSVFRTFIQQDALYLQDFSRVLARLASLAPDIAAARLLLAHADTVFQVEGELHQSAARDLGILEGQLGRGPKGLITKAYGDHMVRQVMQGAFLPALAAVLPCYWTYAEIGTELYGLGLPEDKLLRDWILVYSGDEYRRAVDEIVSLFDRLAGASGKDEDAQVEEVFDWSMIYEWLFWEQAYNGQQFFVN
ncbi:thiaminase II [Sulfobacillus harzensis]|uniref:Aminopyrimidine aminohydrolase n=1 Tax=Sulfobacillus harzensis TaxID=2729629 RepID=A0A7Y0L5H4_9FIRM|nr:thiaminase II [Sulfobacillus harzensis]NMP23398.1 thiaminase II [Sulfobacillus harzensis]